MRVPREKGGDVLNPPSERLGATTSNAGYQGETPVTKLRRCARDGMDGRLELSLSISTLLAEQPPLSCGVVLCIISRARSSPPETPPWRLPSRTCLGLYVYVCPGAAPVSRHEDGSHCPKRDNYGHAGHLAPAQPMQLDSLSVEPGYDAPRCPSTYGGR